jgi:galactokinase/mevalonate kinase-like predicted kinase
MIISRTPLRMSFAGGGSDLPSFYRQFGGAVLSTTVDKYVYVNINKKFDGGFRLAYSKTEEVDTVDQVEHALFKATFQQMHIPGGVEITTIADIPSRPKSSPARAAKSRSTSAAPRSVSRISTPPPTAGSTSLNFIRTTGCR